MLVFVLGRLLRTLRVGAVGALFAASACGQVDRKVDSAQSVSPQIVDTGTPPASPVKRKPPLGGPLLVTDSTARDPRIETQGTNYVLYLPSEMARVLHDSLPGFTPLQQSAYPADLVAQHSSPLSVVIGDFNGDARRDIAVIGDSENTPAFFILLGKSDSIAEPRIISILRPVPNRPTNLRSYYLEYVGPERIAYPDNPKHVLDLRTDAIHAVSEDVSTIYYLLKGELRTFSVGGD